MGRQGRIGLGPLLLSLSLLAVLPILLYGAFLLQLMAGQARDAAQRELTAGAQGLRTLVERDIEQAQEVLELLKTSPGLRETGDVDVERLGSAAGRIVQGRFGIQTLALLDAQGRTVFEYPKRPTAAPRQTVLALHQGEALRTGQVKVSDLRPSRLDGSPTIALDLPVPRPDGARWVLTAELNTRHLAQAMAAQIGQRDAVATLLDRHKLILARTEQMDRFFGQLPSQQTLQALAAGPSGTRRFYTRDGNELLWAWETLSNGWMLMHGTPARAVDSALRKMLAQLAVAGLAVLGLGAAAAFVLARRITRSVDLVANNAHALVEGRSPPYRRTGIRQLDMLYAALQRAGEQVQQAIAEREHALVAETAARAVADEHNRAKDVFIATLSHELRNPLSPIRSAAEILNMPGTDDARRQWAAAVIARQAAAMARLLDDLLDLSRVSRGRVELDRQPVLLEDVLQGAVEVARPLFNVKHHTLQMQLLPQPVVLDADPLRLTQVFANLLTNAAKYTPPGGCIEVQAQLLDAEVLVTVRDNGIGLTPQSLEQVFEMFVQVREPQNPSQGGLGIGLALVRGLVELHGGWVKASSPGLGQGSAFEVGLPVIPPSRPEVSASQDGHVRQATNVQPLRVLVADDNEDAACALQGVLELAGHETRVVHGGHDALKCARAWQPDAACLDIGMPDLSGYEVARRIRAEPWGRRLRLIAVTGWGTPEDKRKAYQAGFDAHLTKPADQAALARLLRPE